MKNQDLKLKKQFSEAWNYIKESKNYIYVTIFLFTISIILGFIFSEKLSFFKEIIKEILKQTEGLNTIEMIFFIMQNNIQSSLLTIILGIAFGIFPLISIILNGTLIGYVLSITSQINGPTTWLLLLPHGIFEIPAILISMGLGIKLGAPLFTNKKPLQEFKRRIYQTANVFIMIIIPTLILAAIIEGILIAVF